MKTVKAKDFDLQVINELINTIQEARDENIKKASRISMDEDQDKKAVWRLLGKDDGYADCMKTLLQTKERLQIQYQNYLTELRSRNNGKFKG